MTEHKMTAKEFLDKQPKVYRLSWVERLLEEYAKEFALQVATEAVEEEKQEWWHKTSLSTFALDMVLKNIKKRLNDE